MPISDFVTVEWAPTSEPTDTTPDWVDITDIVMEVTVEGGRSGVFDLYGPRTATIRCKNGTKAEAATFAIGGFYRWRQIRVVDGNSVPLFTGHILTLEHDQTNAPFSGLVTINCADKMGGLASGEFAATDTDGSTVNGFDNVLTVEEAVQHAIDLIGFNDTVGVLGMSTAFVKLDDEPSGQVLSWLQSVLEAECAGFQIAASGAPTVLGRLYPFDVAAAGASITFSDTPTGFDYPYLRENLVFAATDENYYNRAVTKTPYWEPLFGSHVVDDIPSGYPAETISRTDLRFVYDSWAEANAAHYVKLYSQAVTYPRSLKVFIASHAADEPVYGDLPSFTHTFGSDPIAVEHTPAGTGQTQQTYLVTIENCVHTITPELWTCELGFASVDRWIDAYGDGDTIDSLFVVGTSTVGGTDIIAP